MLDKRGPGPLRGPVPLNQNREHLERRRRPRGRGQGEQQTVEKETAVWSFWEGPLQGLTVKLQLQFESSVWKTVSGEHSGATAD